MKCGGGDGGEGASSTALICTFGISISDSGLDPNLPYAGFTPPQRSHLFFS